MNGDMKKSRDFILTNHSSDPIRTLDYTKLLEAAIFIFFLIGSDINKD